MHTQLSPKYFCVEVSSTERNSLIISHKQQQSKATLMCNSGFLTIPFATVLLSTLHVAKWPPPSFLVLHSTSQTSGILNDYFRRHQCSSYPPQWRNISAPAPIPSGFVLYDQI